MSTPHADPSTMLRERPELGPVMAVLMATGRYDEDQDAFTWLVWESADVFDTVAQGLDPDVPLYSSGYWTEDDGPFPDSLRFDLIAAASGPDKAVTL